MTDATTRRGQLEQAIAETFAAVDSRQTKGAVEVCTDEFVMALPGFEVDRTKFAEMMEARATADYETRHCVTNVRVVSDDGSRAEVAYTVTAHRVPNGATESSVTVADFIDIWLAAVDGWTLDRRSITPAFDLPIAH